MEEEEEEEEKRERKKKVHEGRGRGVLFKFIKVNEIDRSVGEIRLAADQEELYIWLSLEFEPVTVKI